MEYAKLFGLDDYTGLYEDLGVGGESKGKVPSEEAKIDSTKTMLKTYLNKGLNALRLYIGREIV